MTNRIRGFLPPPDDSQPSSDNNKTPASNGGEALYQFTLTAHETALIMNCLNAGLAASGRATRDPLKAAMIIAKTGNALHSFEAEVWLEVLGKFKKVEDDLRACGGLQAEEHDDDLPFGDQQQEPKEPWQ